LCTSSLDCVIIIVYESEDVSMNLFILDKDPVKAAQLQCDKHVVKMIVESGQML